MCFFVWILNILQFCKYIEKEHIATQTFFFLILWHSVIDNLRRFKTPAIPLFVTFSEARKQAE